MIYIQKLKELFDIAMNYFAIFWRHNIVTVGTSPIQIGNIILALLVLVLGIKYLKYLNIRIKNYIRSKLGKDKDSANILERTANYSVIFIFIILVLEISNIPISSLAFIGGALALGIGLGAQNLIGNFISSIILIIEKPLKIGDIIEVEGVVGTVTSLGGRCVTITTNSNYDVLVPTSKLLQTSFVNWSLNDNLIKKSIKIKVGFLAKSDKNTKTKSKLDFEKCMDVIQNILENNQEVLKKPEPTIHFINIHDNACTYEIKYWHDLGNDKSLQDVKNSLSAALANALGKYNVKFAIYHPSEAKQTVISEGSEGSELFKE